MSSAVKLRKLTTEDWIDKGLEFVQEAGFRRLAVDTIAAWLGVTKGAFYYHFSEKAEFEAALLERYIATTVREIALELTDIAPPQVRLKRVLRKQIDTNQTRLPLIFRAWGLHNPAVASELKKIDQFRLKHATYLFEDLGFSPADAGVRAHVLVAFLHGESALYSRLTREEGLKQVEIRYRFFVGNCK